MNATPLQSSGIADERSNLRCHVAPATRSIFVFRTDDARRVLLSGTYRKVTATQPGVDGVTAEGYAVPWQHIPHIMALRWTTVPWWERFAPTMTTSEKGAAAVRVVQDLLRLGRFPLPIQVRETTDTAVQIAGTDLVVRGTWTVQVKCDYRAGGVPPDGTGNLFLQVAECNPLRRI